MNDNTQLVRLTPETKLDAQRIPYEVAAVVEEKPESSQSKKDYSEREFLLRMDYEIQRMKRCEILVYIVIVFAVMVAIITPLVVTRYLPPPGRATSITVTGNGISSITTSGGGYSVIITSGDGVSVSTVMIGGSTSVETKQKSAGRKAKREHKAAKREEKRKQREAKRLERQAVKMERQAEKLRRKVGQMK